MKQVGETGTGPNWIGLAASFLAAASCYGPLAVMIVLSTAGIALDFDERIWVLTIALFSLVAVAAVALGILRHGKGGPIVLAAAGFGLIAWTLFGDYLLMLEIVGFAMLVTAAGWDWQLRRAIT